MRKILVSSLAMAFAFAVAVSPVRGATIDTSTLGGGADAPAAPGAAIDLMLNGNMLDGSLVFSGFTTSNTAWVSFGAYTGVVKLTDPAVYAASFLSANGETAANAEAALIAALNSGMAYMTAEYSGGTEISGYLTTATSSVPEPATFLLGASMLAASVFFRRKKPADRR